MKLSILIPAYNEENFIERIMSEVKAVDLSSLGISEKEIILIDDGSTDATVKKATAIMPTAKVVHHAKNQGKGAAIGSSIPLVTGDLILIQDADLEYSPSLYPILLKVMLEEKADVVYGSRFLCKGHPKKMKLAYFLANRFGAILINLLNRTHLTDPMTCFKVFRKNTLEGMTLACKGFGIDSELTLKVIKRGFKIKEVPIPYTARTFKEGKKFHPLCSLNVLYSIIRYSLPLHLRK